MRFAHGAEQGRGVSASRAWVWSCLGEYEIELASKSAPQQISSSAQRFVAGKNSGFKSPDTANLEKSRLFDRPFVSGGVRIYT
jgi:hypothetical protein